MFAKRAACFTQPQIQPYISADQVARGEAYDLYEMSNDRRKPLTKVICEIYEIIDQIQAGSKEPEGLRPPPVFKNYESSSSDYSDVICL